MTPFFDRVPAPRDPGTIRSGAPSRVPQADGKTPEGTGYLNRPTVLDAEVTGPVANGLNSNPSTSTVAFHNTPDGILGRDLPG